jgi:hypothetical protein
MIHAMANWCRGIVAFLQDICGPDDPGAGWKDDYNQLRDYQE